MFFTRMINTTAAALFIGAVPLCASGGNAGYDFENGSLAGLKVQSGKWSVVKDSTGNKVLKSETPRGEIYLDAGKKFKNFELTAGVRTYQGDLYERICLRTQDGADYTKGYSVVLHTAWNDKKRSAYLPKLFFYKGKKVLASGKLMRYSKYDKMLKIRIVAIGNTFEGYINDGVREEKIFSCTDHENTYPEGRIGFAANLKASSHFDNIKVQRDIVPAAVKALSLYPFEDNFENLPIGELKSTDKWTVFKSDKTKNKVEVVNVPGRGKVIHVWSEWRAASIKSKLPITKIPYMLEFDLKVPAAKANPGMKTLSGNLRLNFFASPKAKKVDWFTSFNNFSYTFRVTKTSKSNYQPTQCTGKDWGQVRIKVDGDIFSINAIPQNYKGKKRFESFNIPEFKSDNGYIEFLAYPSWGYEAKEFWLDNVKVSLLPVAERNAYLQKKQIYQEFGTIFNSELYKEVSGNKLPAEFAQINTILDKTAKLAANDVIAYNNALADLDRLFAKCSAHYRKYENAIFAKLFQQKEAFIPLDITSLYNHTPAKRLPAFGKLLPLAKVENIPFRTSPVFPYTHQFTLVSKSAVKIPVGTKAKEIFLLMMPQWELDFLKNGVYPSVSMTHNDGPIDRRDLSVSGSSEVIHQAFQVEIKYADGSRERAVPLLYKNLVPCMDMGKLSVYTIRPTMDKKIASITMLDRMNDWAGILYGITLGLKTPKAIPQGDPEIPAKTIKKGPGVVKIAGNQILFESPAYRFSMAKNGVLRFTEMFNKYSDRNFLKGNSGALLLTGKFALANTYSKLKDGKDGVLTPVKPDAPHFACWTIKSVKQTGKDTVVFEIENATKNLSGKLIAKAEENQVRLIPSIRNNGKQEEKLSIIFPLLKNIQADEYLLPLRNGIISDRALNFYADYGSNMHCMMQIISAWDKNKQASLTMRVEDSNGEMKAFRFYKKHPKVKKLQPFAQLGGRNRPFFGNEIGDYGNGMLMGTQYYCIEIGAGKEKQLPAAVISVNPGTWKEPLRQYAAWLKTWCKPLREIPEKTRKVALSVTGGGLNEQSKPKTGLEWGGVDVVHLYYLHSVDYPEVIEKTMLPAILRAQNRYASLPVPLGHGIYAVEGSYLRTETKLFADVKYKWAHVNHKGQYNYFQPLTKDQVLMCRTNADWPKMLAKQVALVANKVGPTWVYVDTIGVAGPSLCFNEKHDHGKKVAEELRGIAQEMKTISTELIKANPNVGLLTEGPGCDYLTQFRDGSWSSLRGWETFNNPGNFIFFRYLFPKFKFIELGGDSVTRSKINFFNGVPVNIYIYRGEDRTTSTLKPLVPAYRKYYQLFTGDDMEPDVSTGEGRKHGVFMNRFGNIKNKRVVFSVANWGHITWRGKLKLDYFPGAKYTVATDGDRVLKHTVLPGNKQAEVEIAIDPYEVMYIAVTE